PLPAPHSRRCGWRCSSNVAGSADKATAGKSSCAEFPDELIFSTGEIGEKALPDASAALMITAILTMTPTRRGGDGPSPHCSDLMNVGTGRPHPVATIMRIALIHPHFTSFK